VVQREAGVGQDQHRLRDRPPGVGHHARERGHHQHRGGHECRRGDGRHQDRDERQRGREPRERAGAEPACRDRSERGSGRQQCRRHDRAVDHAQRGDGVRGVRGEVRAGERTGGEGQGTARVEPAAAGDAQGRGERERASDEQPREHQQPRARALSRRVGAPDEADERRDDDGHAAGAEAAADAHRSGAARAPVRRRRPGHSVFRYSTSAALAPSGRSVP
jgi:hypothetical protein